MSDRVVVVGGRADLAGLLPDPYRGDARIQVRVALSRPEYAEMCTRAGRLVAAPGLAAIYECQTAGLTPLFQPGFNMSMLLQAHRLATAGYPHVAAWPWMGELYPQLAVLEEAEGIRLVAQHVRESIDSDSDHVDEAIRQYLKDPTAGWHLPDHQQYPDGAAGLSEYLRQWQEKS